MKLTCLMLIGLLCGWLKNAWAVEMTPRPEPVPGGFVALPIIATGNERPTAHYQGRRVLVIPQSDHYLAVIGIPLEARIGTQTVTVEGGKTKQLTFQVKPKHYAEQRITLANERQVNPNEEDMQRINDDLKHISAAKSYFSERDPDSLVLLPPATGPTSSPFGLRRFFNNQPRNPHSGLDIAVDIGTPVHAAAAGTVINTGDYFFNGKSVFIEHGQGFITMYCHLSQIQVKEGQQITRGEQIALSGMTGRATGPHVHLSVILNNTMVDPTLFLPPSATAKTP
jgi:murein DD-endopeptidase MepM/ murein hydrolase activator NlpD